MKSLSGLRSLIERFGYSQIKVAKLMNKSESYVSQILGLERLSRPAREILQTSEVSKEVQIRASREKEPSKQQEILKKASEEGKTVRQIRKEENCNESARKKQIPTQNNQKFQEWTWRPKNGRFILTIHFSHEQKEEQKIRLVRDSLEEALLYLK